MENRDKIMENKRIVMLAGKGESSRIIFNAINSRFPVHTVIMEDKENKKVFIKRRIKRLGIIKVFGQILFQILILKSLKVKSNNRIKEILKDNHLNHNEVPSDKRMEVTSINAVEVKEALIKINPDVIIVNGTRIISKKILNAVSCPFINTHVGITPMYRGVHGGYWALVNNDSENCGVTVHLVDAGIDTGGILYQENIEITKKDNFATYPFLQTAKAVSMIQRAVENALSGNLKSISRAGNSKLWYHPTIWEYLYFRIVKKVK